jgi:hypothetical protein
LFLDIEMHRFVTHEFKFAKRAMLNPKLGSVEPRSHPPGRKSDRPRKLGLKILLIMLDELCLLIMFDTQHSLSGIFVVAIENLVGLLANAHLTSPLGENLQAI